MIIYHQVLIIRNALYPAKWLITEANLFNMIPSFVPFDTAFKDAQANKNAIETASEVALEFLSTLEISCFFQNMLPISYYILPCNNEFSFFI